MKRQKMNIDKILTDDVLIFAYRRKLWKKYRKLTKYNLSDEVIEFLLFLESVFIQMELTLMKLELLTKEIFVIRQILQTTLLVI